MHAHTSNKRSGPTGAVNHNNHTEHFRPEWADCKTITRIFGIGKSTLYRLVDEGKIKSSSLRERGKLRGKRLFSADSVAAFIESMVINDGEANTR